MDGPAASRPGWSPGLPGLDCTDPYSIRPDNGNDADAPPTAQPPPPPLRPPRRRRPQPSASSFSLDAPARASHHSSNHHHHNLSGLALVLVAAAAGAALTAVQGGGRHRRRVLPVTATTTSNRGGTASSTSSFATAATTATSTQDSAALTTPAAVLAALEADGTAAQLTASGEVLDAACVGRWVQARKGDCDAAAAGLRAHAAWRAAAVGPGRTTFDEATLAPVLHPPRIFLQGLDTRGRPVLVIRARSHARGAAEETSRLVAYALDACFAAAGRWSPPGCPPASPLGPPSVSPANPGRRLVILLDLRGIRLSAADPRALGGLATMLTQHYPERLDAFYMIGAPALFWGLWRVMQPFIVPGVKRKINFLKGPAGEATLRSFIPPDVLPSDLGGGAPPVPVEEAVAAAAAAEAAALAAARSGSARLAAALHLPSVHLPSVHLPSVHLPSVHLPARPHLPASLSGASPRAAVLALVSPLVAVLAWMLRILAAALAGGDDWLGDRTPRQYPPPPAPLAPTPPPKRGAVRVVAAPGSGGGVAFRG